MDSHYSSVLFLTNFTWYRQAINNPRKQPTPLVHLLFVDFTARPWMRWGNSAPITRSSENTDNKAQQIVCILLDIMKLPRAFTVTSYCLKSPSTQLFRITTKKTSKFHTTDWHSVRVFPFTGGFPSQMAWNVESVSMVWAHHGDPQQLLHASPPGACLYHMQTSLPHPTCCVAGPGSPEQSVLLSAACHPAGATASHICPMTNLSQTTPQWIGWANGIVVRRQLAS